MHDFSALADEVKQVLPPHSGSNEDQQAFLGARVRKLVEVVSAGCAKIAKDILDTRGVIAE